MSDYQLFTFRTSKYEQLLKHCITYEDKVPKIKELKVIFEMKEQKYLPKNLYKTSFVGELRQLIEYINERLFYRISSQRQ